MNPDEALVGSSLAGRYRIDSLLARGGMARVYRARDERLDRDVAVKVLSPPYADDPAFTGRFLDEARAAASLSHPSLVHVYDSGSDGDTHYIVMELLDRHRTLREILAERSRMPPSDVLRIGRELLAGLRVVHERGLVHCDVKPANVMLGPGAAKLIDFGIATAPHDGLEGETSIGSLHSMSPEQLHGEALSPSSDLFSLGVVLYEALTGRPPYPGETPEAVSQAHAAGRVRPPSTLAEGIPGRLDAAILQALRREPTARFRSAEAMTVALAAAAEELETERDDETRVVARPGADSGYVPPAAPPPPSAVAANAPRRDSSPRPRPVQRPAPRRRGIPWNAIGTFLVLAAAALVVVLVVVPLLELGRQGGGATDPTPTAVATPAATPAPAGDVVTVPDAVGMSKDEAIAAAQEAGLNWRIECAQDESQPEGMIDQEPAAGAQVARGSRFTMYSARISDCR